MDTAPEKDRRERGVSFSRSLLARVVLAIVVGIAHASMLLAASAHAQAYPSRLVRMMTPQAAGSGIDAMLRATAAAWSERSGQPVIVENRPGVNTIVNTDACRKTTPDGHTLCMITSSGYLNPFLYSKLPFDLQKDLVPVTNLVIVPEMMAVHSSIPASTWQELLTWSKANPGKLNYSGFGPGSTPQMVFEWMKKHAGLDVTHIPYKNVVEGMNGFLGGESHLVAVGVSNLFPHVRSGKARGLFTAMDRRHPLVPNVPTVTEAGAPDWKYRTWFGLAAPAGTPRELIERAAAEMGAIFSVPAFRDKILAVGYEPATSNPESFARFLTDALANAAEVVKASGAKLD